MTETEPAALASRIARVVGSSAAGPVFTPTCSPELTVYKVSGPTSHTHLVYRPSLCVVAQGTKTAQLGRAALKYDARRFFFAGLPVPAIVVAQAATEAKPLLGLILELKLEDLCQVHLDMTEAGAVASHHRPLNEQPAAFTGLLSSGLVAALDRLVDCASDSVRHRVLYAGALKEVLFVLLTSPLGRRLRELVSSGGATQAVIEAARMMDRNPERAFSVPQLARLAGMSPSSYYQRFREVTSLSPVQYLKRMRLHRARTMILAGTTVTRAAFDVGYASPSQFSREFRALFGHPPRTTAGLRSSDATGDSGSGL